MNYFVVRIYRGDAKNGVVGLVEDVNRRTTVAFRDRDELWAALLERPDGDGAKAPAPRRRARPEKKG